MRYSPIATVTCQGNKLKFLIEPIVQSLRGLARWMVSNYSDCPLRFGITRRGGADLLGSAVDFFNGIAAATITIEMPAAINVYSMAVALSQWLPFSGRSNILCKPSGDGESYSAPVVKKNGFGVMPDNGCS